LRRAPCAYPRGKTAGYYGAQTKAACCANRKEQKPVYRAIYAEVNARLQAEAMRFGEITFLSDTEAANASRTNDENLDRPWQLWKKKIRS